MNGITIGWILTGLFIIITLIGVGNGITRGVGRQAIRTSTLAVSVLLAFFATASSASKLSSFCEGKSLGEALMSLDLHRSLSDKLLDTLFCFDAEVAEQLLAIPLRVLLLPFVFLAVFALIAIISLLIYIVLSKLFCAPGGRISKASRITGALLGAVQGIIIGAMLILPVASLADLAADTNDRLLEKHGGDAEGVAFCEFYDKYLEGIDENLLIRAVNTVATEPICNGFANIKIDGEQVNLRDTAAHLITAYEDVSSLGEFNWISPTPEERGELRVIITELSDDVYLSSVLSGTLRGIATALDKGIVDLKLDEPVLGLARALMQVFTTLDAESLRLDVATFLDVYDLLAGEEVLTAMTEGGTDAVASALIAKDTAGQTVIIRIVDTIEENERMKPLLTVLVKLSLSVMMNDIGIENGAAIYDGIKAGLAAVIAIDKSAYGTDAEYREAVSESLNATMLEHGISLHPDVIDGMADYVADNLSDTTEITDDEIYATIFSYYDAYSEHIGEAEVLP